MDSSFDNLPCGIADVVDLLDIQIIRNTGTQLHCRCPFCGDKKAHLNVNIKKNIFRCNRCGKGGGVLHLYADFHDVTLNTAYEELCRIFQSAGSPDAVIRRTAPRKPVVVKPELPLASSEVRHNTYSNLLSLLSLGANHRESLLRRGLSGDEIVRLGYKTTPAVRAPKIVTELLERGCDLRGVPGFYCDKDTGRWKLDIRGSGIMIPDRNCKGEIEAIQVRLDKVYHSKFYTLTSVEQYCGTTASCCPHFAGVEQGMDTVYLTEGVMKSDVARSISVQLGQSRAFVGLTGVSNITQCQRALQELTAMGVRRINLAFDMDALTNPNVRKAKERVLETANEAGFEVFPISWSPAYKGIDDLLLSKLQRQLNQKSK